MYSKYSFGSGHFTNTCLWQILAPVPGGGWSGTNSRPYSSVCVDLRKRFLILNTSSQMYTRALTELLSDSWQKGVQGLGEVFGSDQHRGPQAGLPNLDSVTAPGCVRFKERRNTGFMSLWCYCWLWCIGVCSWAFQHPSFMASYRPQQPTLCWSL